MAMIFLNTLGRKSSGNKIFIIRNKKVMLDEDLAEIFDMRVKELIALMRRDFKTIPDNFIFQLNSGETDTIKFQSDLHCKSSHRLVYVFTLQGALMLSKILDPNRRSEADIQIARTFIQYDLVKDKGRSSVVKFESRDDNFKDGLLLHKVKESKKKLSKKRKKIGYKGLKKES